jgi:tetrahydrodipicolinate N-succinyltransferase
MVFTNDLTPRSKYPKNRLNFKKTLVKYGASIGANATIVCGTTIGRWAMIASGAVVTKDVPDYALMAGIPAKQIGWVCECGKTIKNGFKCQDCGKEYILIDNKLKYKNFKSRGFKHKRFIQVDLKKINCEKIKEWKIYKELLKKIDDSKIDLKKLIKTYKDL